MALTENGLEVKSFTEINQEINQDFSTNAGVPIDTSSDSIAAIMNAIVARKIAELWELGEAINDSTDILKAEGSALDDLALRVGKKRAASRRTRGEAHFKGSDGVTITPTAKMSTSRGDRYETTNDVLITSSLCVELTASISTILDNTVYQITVNNTVYSVTSGSNATADEIINLFITAMQGGATFFTATNRGGFLHIESTDRSLDISAYSSTYITFDDIVSRGLIQSTEFGLIAGDANSVVIVESAINGWDEVTNPDNLILGRDTQTDVELRNTILTAYDSQKAGTFEGIKSSLLEVIGVEDVIIEVNREWSTDLTTNPSQPLPPKSYHCTVYGGIESEVAKVVWETQPLGIKTVGNQSVDILDKFNQEQTVSFSRPVDRPLWFNVTIDQYDEEVLPTDAQALIAQAVFEEAANLSIGNDVIAQRYVGSIYRAVDGVSNVTIEVSLDGTNFSTNTVSVAATQIAYLPLSSITVTINP